MTKPLKQLIIFVVCVIVLPLLLGNFVMLMIISNRLAKSSLRESTQMQMEITTSWQYGWFKFKWNPKKNKAQYDWQNNDVHIIDTNEIHFLYKIGYLIEYSEDSVIDWNNNIFKKYDTTSIADFFGLIEVLNFWGHNGWELVDYYYDYNPEMKNSEEFLRILFKKRIYDYDSLDPLGLFETK